VSRMPTARKTSLFLLPVLLLAVGCAQNQRVATETGADKTVLSSTPPFETKEPERYRATRTITITTAAGETSVTKNLIARDGELRRNESETQGQPVVYLTLPEGRFVLLPNEKLYAPVEETQTSDEEEASETSPDRLLHTELITPGYQKLGSETLGGKNLQKYRVIVNNSAGENVSAGETLLWFDDKLQMPVRTESRSPNGTRTITELANVALDVDKTLFQIPKDYEKIEFSKLRERLKSSQP
jgi:outer membrane lipoprotein-sorting protein